MTAILKSRTKSYLSRGNDVSTPEELYQAFTHSGGVSDCGVAFVSFRSQEETKDEDPKIKGISLLRNFAFAPDRITTHKAYDTGSGQKKPRCPNWKSQK